MNETQRALWAAGDWREAPVVLVRTKPRPFTANEAMVFRFWQRLSMGRRSGGMGGAGSIPLGDLWELLDREGIADPVRREFIERMIYHMDYAARRQAEALNKTR